MVFEMARISILLYHHISQNVSEGLTVSTENLEKQFRWISQKGYQTHHFSELITSQKYPKGKSVIITFDDGYVSQWQWAYPLLKKYHLKATFFIPMKYIGGEDEWNRARQSIMTVEQLKGLDPAVIELGYHSYGHINYQEVSPEVAETDLKQAITVARESTLPMQPLLAYPYGKFPRENPEREVFEGLLKMCGIQYAFRIGNKVSTFPFKNPYEIKRLDIKGEFSFERFKRKVKYGQLF